MPCGAFRAGEPAHAPNGTQEAAASPMRLFMCSRRVILVMASDVIVRSSSANRARVGSPEAVDCSVRRHHKAHRLEENIGAAAIELRRCRHSRTCGRTLTGQHTGRQRVKDRAADSALGAESIVEWPPAVSIMDRTRACLRQIAWSDGRPGSRPTGVNSVSSPG